MANTPRQFWLAMALILSSPVFMEFMEHKDLNKNFEREHFNDPCTAHMPFMAKDDFIGPDETILLRTGSSGILARVYGPRFKKGSNREVADSTGDSGSKEGALKEAQDGPWTERESGIDHRSGTGHR